MIDLSEIGVWIADLPEGAANVREWLKGKKTYIVGIGMIIYAVGVQGYLERDFAAAGQTILSALALMGLRAGVKKVEEKQRA